MQDRFAGAANLIFGVVAATPFLLALAAMNQAPSGQAWLTLVAAVIWLVLVIVQRNLAGVQERRERTQLHNAMDQLRDALFESSGAFQDRLTEHKAILDRIIEVSRQTVDDGITDPQLTLKNVSLIENQARHAQSLVEDAILETRIEIGSVNRNITAVDVRSEIETIANQIAAPGLLTTGPTQFAATDQAMFRAIVRNLIAAALEHKADEIDVAVARNGDMVVCSITDNGTACNPDADTPPLARVIARALGTDIEYARRMNRNQFSFPLPAATEATTARTPTTPLDVLGSRQSPATVIEEKQPVRRPPRTRGPITFTDTAAPPTREQTVAERRNREMISR